MKIKTIHLKNIKSRKKIDIKDILTENIPNQSIYSEDILNCYGDKQEEVLFNKKPEANEDENDISKLKDFQVDFIDLEKFLFHNLLEVPIHHHDILILSLLMS